ncbi:hypothetical protein, partial [Pseudomonas aeruginosa]|uniref:hypothetical protein n=1 Tax=Pseudomonas aeruginosa TaxID=287 RepID=UPI001F2FC4F6
HYAKPGLSPQQPRLARIHHRHPGSRTHRRNRRRVRGHRRRRTGSCLARPGHADSRRYAVRDCRIERTVLDVRHASLERDIQARALLAKELDVSIDTILFGENAGMSAEMRDLFRRFDELSPAVKPQAKLLLRALLFSLESGAAQGEEHAA